jgi:hypothetical protein
LLHVWIAVQKPGYALRDVVLADLRKVRPWKLTADDLIENHGRNKGWNVCGYHIGISSSNYNVHGL